MSDAVPTVPVTPPYSLGTPLDCPKCGAELRVTINAGPGGDIVELPCCVCKATFKVRRA